jgi:RND superfamily putative drug exporter
VRVIALWAVAVVASCAVVALFLGDALTANIETTRQTDSKQGAALLARAFPQDPAQRDRAVTETVVVRGRAGDRTLDARVRALARELHAAGATGVVTSLHGKPLVSGDGRARAILLGLGPDGDERIPAVYRAVQRVDAQPAYEAAVSGGWTSDADQGQASRDDLRAGELLFGLPAALLVLLLVFGAVVAGLVPIVLALVSIVIALALATGLGQAYDLSLYSVNMVTAMGLALGIDYSLFVLSRYREERARGRSEREAIAVAGETASRAVLFSGMTFVLAMFGVALVPTTIFRSLAAGAILVGVVSVLAALTLLPAVLGLLGDRINAVRLPVFGRAADRAGSEGRVWGAIVRAVMRRPLLSLVLSAGLLLVLAVPVLGLETGSQGRSTLPDRFETKRGYVLLTEEFPRLTTDPVEIVVAGDASSAPVRAGVRRLEGGLARRSMFARPTVAASPSRDVTRVTVPMSGDPDAPPAIRAVRELRERVIPRALAGVPATAFVTGSTAQELDYQDTINAWAAPIIAVVLGLSFVLLTVAFRSIVVSLKSILLNLLSVGAAYGLLVTVFQTGTATRSSAWSTPTTSRRGCRCSYFRCCSGCPWTIRCSCSAGSASATA